VEIDLDPTTNDVAGATWSRARRSARGRMAGSVVPSQWWGYRGKATSDCASSAGGPAAWDVLAYAQQHPTYSCDSTLEQMYDATEFEAYHQLGAAAVHSPAPPNHSSQTLHRALKRHRPTPSTITGQSAAPVPGPAATGSGRAGRHPAGQADAALEVLGGVINEYHRAV